MPTPFNYPLFRSRCLLIRGEGRGAGKNSSLHPLFQKSPWRHFPYHCSRLLSLSLFFFFFFFFPRFFLVFGEEVPSRSFFFLFVLMSSAVFHFFLHFSIFSYFFFSHVIKISVFLKQKWVNVLGIRCNNVHFIVLRMERSYYLFRLRSRPTLPTTNKLVKFVEFLRLVLSQSILRWNLRLT